MPHLPNMDLGLLSDIIRGVAEKAAPFYKLGSAEEFVETKGGKLRNKYREVAHKVLDTYSGRAYQPYVPPGLLGNSTFCPHSIKTGRHLSQQATAPKQPLKKAHRSIDMFLKTEIYGELGKDPRMISGRNPVFNLGYCQFTSAIEEALAKAFPGYMIGKSPLEAGKWFKEHLLGKTILEADYSRFDASMHWYLLFLVEVQLAYHLMPYDQFEVFYKYWTLKIEKFGRYPSGLAFDFIGTRASGETETLGFNSLLSLVCALYYCRVNKLNEEDVCVLGDDNLLPCPADGDYVDTFKLFGLKAECKVVHDYHDATFCSGHFMQINRNGDFMLVQNLMKTLNNIGIVKSKSFDHCLGEYYYNLGYMYENIFPNFPGYQELSGFLKRMTSNKQRYVNPNVLDLINYNYRANLESSLAVRPQADYDFLLSEYYLCYGVAHHELSYSLDFLKSHTPQLPPSMDKRYRVGGTKPQPKPDYNLVQQCIDEAVMATCDYGPAMRRLFGKHPGLYILPKPNVCRGNYDDLVKRTIHPLNGAILEQRIGQYCNLVC